MKLNTTSLTEIPFHHSIVKNSARIDSCVIQESRLLEENPPWTQVRRQHLRQTLKMTVLLRVNNRQRYLANTYECCNVAVVVGSLPKRQRLGQKENRSNKGPVDFVVKTWHGLTQEVVSFSFIVDQHVDAKRSMNREKKSKVIKRINVKITTRKNQFIIRP